MQKIESKALNKPLKFVPATKSVASTGLADARRLAERYVLFLPGLPEPSIIASEIENNTVEMGHHGMKTAIRKKICNLIKNGDLLIASFIMSGSFVLKTAFIFYLLFMLITYGKTHHDSNVYLAVAEIIIGLVTFPLVIYENYLVASLKHPRYRLRGRYKT